MKRKKVYSVVRDPDFEKKVEIVKKWSGEKTDSKAIRFVFEWGFGNLRLK